MAWALLEAAVGYTPILSLSAFLILIRSEWIMQDMHPDTESPNPNDMFRLAQEAVRKAPEYREARIAAARRALSDDQLMLNAEVLASQVMADPLHRVNCDV
jgi:hypothetical protein